MQRLFESKLEKGFLDLYEAEGALVVLSGFTRAARGVHLELPEDEAADLAEALLRRLGEATARSVYTAVVRDTMNKELGVVENKDNNNNKTNHNQKVTGET